MPLDVFAAGGFFGFLPFLWFFLTITAGERPLIRANFADDRARWLQALIRALLFEWFALCADQNLLRTYLWFHVTMIVVVGYNLRYFREGESNLPVSWSAMPRVPFAGITPSPYSRMAGAAISSVSESCSTRSDFRQQPTGLYRKSTT